MNSKGSEKQGISVRDKFLKIGMKALSLRQMVGKFFSSGIPFDLYDGLSIVKLFPAVDPLHQLRSV